MYTLFSDLVHLLQGKETQGQTQDQPTTTPQNENQADNIKMNKLGEKKENKQLVHHTILFTWTHQHKIKIKTAWTNI